MPNFSASNDPRHYKLRNFGGDVAPPPAIPASSAFFEPAALAPASAGPPTAATPPAPLAATSRPPAPPAAPPAQSPPPAVAPPPVPPQAVRIDARGQPVRERTTPSNILCPPGVLGDVAQWISGTAYRPIPQLSTLSAIAFGAAVMGNSYRGPTGLGPNLYLTGIAPTGSGKDHCLSSVAELLRYAGLGGMVGGETLASGSAMLSRLAECPNTIYLIDELGKYLAAVMDPKGVGHLREVSDYMLKLSGTLKPVFRGKDYANRSARKTSEIHYPCLNVYGMTTASSFYDSLSRAQIEDGFLNRLLVVEIDDSKLPRVNKQRASQEPPEAFIEWAARICGQSGRPGVPGTSLRGIDPSAPIVVQYSNAAAQRILDDYLAFADAEYERLKCEGGGLEALTRRWHEHALKLALVAACSTDAEDPRIGIVEATWAVEFTRSCARHALESVGGKVSDSPFHDRVQKAIQEVSKAGKLGLSRRDMVKKSRLFKSLTQREMDDVLGRIVDLGDVVRVQTSPQREAYIHVDNLPEAAPTGAA